MVKEVLEQLFDSPVKVKLLKLFLRNPDYFFEIGEIARRIKSDSSVCRRQVSKLESINLITSKLKSNKKVYSVNSDFGFYTELRTLVLKSSPASKDKILKRLKVIGAIKLVLLSGVFVNLDNARVDLLVVGDNIDNKKMGAFLRDLEAEVGKEIDYVVLSLKEFRYRHDMFDRFLRDILEKPHEKLINKLKV
ncbi:MAG: hypothetical protein CMI55_00610 [Parcubacteria group bacterium]|jgi:hypothetical protein|nr:hypothetical protein [Parcubacteria group bacterium]|tara:strand:+ start:8277 stop:8852 length:576 start_codon:yes stop_codon:yes gene_type:complete